MIVCTKDVKEGKVNDRYLAPAISRFAADMRRKVGTGADTDRQTKEVRGKLEDLHQRWGKANVTPNSEDIKEQAGNEAKVTNRFIRIMQRKDLPWGKDSIARAANDPEHIPDCNVQATVGQHFLFHEPIPKTANGQGYLRVTTKSLWWQHAEGLSTCSENGYQWTTNSTMWNHLRLMWQGQPLDLLRRIH